MWQSGSKVMHRKWWIIVLATALIVTSAGLWAGQEAPAAPEAAKPAATESSSTNKGKHSHANDLLIRGTVFDNRGLSLSGTKLRIRRAGEKKGHWETQSNSRGEFAIRVPQGAEYEVAAEAKGFAAQSQSINGKSGIAEEKVIFHMEPAGGGKR
jgi:hypothetical protein